MGTVAGAHCPPDGAITPSSGLRCSCTKQICISIFVRTSAASELTLTQTPKSSVCPQMSLLFASDVETLSYLPSSLQNMPNVRDHDASVYLRLQGDALSIGGYEHNPIFWDEVMMISFCPLSILPRFNQTANFCSQKRWRTEDVTLILSFSHLIFLKANISAEKTHEAEPTRWCPCHHRNGLWELDVTL